MRKRSILTLVALVVFVGGVGIGWAIRSAAPETAPSAGEGWLVGSPDGSFRYTALNEWPVGVLWWFLVPLILWVHQRLTLLERHWQLYLDGKIDFDRAIARMANAL